LKVTLEKPVTMQCRKIYAIVPATPG